MKTVFDQQTSDELTNRINALNEGSTAQWGTMNVSQMMRHCIIAEEMFMGRKKYSRVLIGRIFGRLALRNMLKDDGPMGRNAPTAEAAKVRETEGDIPAEREKWTALIREYAHFSNPDFVHWFFGRMTNEQVGQFAYKHADHHPRQFNS